METWPLFFLFLRSDNCVDEICSHFLVWIRSIDGQKFTSSDNWCSEDWNEVSYKSVSLFIRN